MCISCNGDFVLFLGISCLVSVEMSFEDDMEEVAAKDKIHRLIDSMPGDARFAFVYENHCKEVHEGECENIAQIIVSANCTQRDVIYLAKILEEEG